MYTEESGSIPDRRRKSVTRAALGWQCHFRQPLPGSTDALGMSDTLDMPIEVVAEQLLEQAHRAPTAAQRIAAWRELERLGFRDSFALLVGSACRKQAT